ncbi:unnamed protein product [Schistocephalus solidus]|uniref:Tubulin-specific chaperone A n=1 Tax=Schistocephalus solidus TaxID=70667 RepID=A0A183SZF5_SCHSO|nr:unnamed protein product [Schistocephalus solidus]
MSRKRSRSRGVVQDRTLKLTAEQKCTIAQVEIEDYKQDMAALKASSEKIIDGYKEKEQVEAATAKLKQLIGDYRVPAAFAYVDCVRDMRTLRRKEKIHERKVAIAKVSETQRTEARKPTNARPHCKRVQQDMCAT